MIRYSLYIFGRNTRGVVPCPRVGLCVVGLSLIPAHVHFDPLCRMASASFLYCEVSIPPL